MDVDDDELELAAALADVGRDVRDAVRLVAVTAADFDVAWAGYANEAVADQLRERITRAC